MEETPQDDPTTYDMEPALVTEEEVAYTREVLNGSYPDFVLEIQSAAQGLGVFLEGRDPPRALMVRGDAERLRSELIEWFGDGEIQFEVAEVEERLDTPFDGYVLVVPADMPELFPFLLERDYSDFFLVTYVSMEMWGYDVEPRDHAPSIDDLKVHFGQFAPNVDPATPPGIVSVDSRLRLYLMRHYSWSDTVESVTFILSERDGQVIGRS